jgi:RNA 2',3'-cyclic 3'-phosphodiesterase
MPRWFTALELPRDVAVRLSLLRAPIRGAHWIAPEDMHLTLRFVGDVSNDTADLFATLLADLASDPFALTISGLGAFGGQHPTTVFAAVEPNPHLTALQKSHDRAARASGIAADPRGFVPHVTLARLRGARPGPVAEFLQTHGHITFPPFQLTQCVLLSAKPGSGGGPYGVEEVYPFEEPLAE